MKTRATSPTSKAAPAGAKAPSPLRSAGALHKAMDCDAARALATAGHSPGTEGAEETDLPEGWRMRRLGDLIQRPQYGLTASATNDPHGPRFLRITDIQESGVNWTTVPSCACDRQTMERVKLVPGDVVIARIGATTGKAHLIRDQVNALFASYLIRLRTEKGLDAEYLYNFTNSSGYWQQIDAVKGGRLKQGVNIPLLESLEIPVPPLPEQRAIAGVLRTVQGAKEACERVLAATRQLKQSLLHHLFTYGPAPFAQADQVALKETEIGEMPQHWSNTTLGEHTSIGNGSTPKRTEPRYWVGGTIPWLTSGKVHEGTIRAGNELVTDVARRECHLPIVPQGSLVVAITGQGKTLGNAALLALDACVSQHLAYVTFHGARLLPGFALVFLRSRYDQLQAAGRAGGSTKGALTCGFLKNFAVQVPPLSEQREIARQLTAVDAKLAALETRRAALAALFNSLLHRLMTARLRLPEFLNAKAPSRQDAKEAAA